MLNKIKIGDIVFCKRTYIDTEVVDSLKKYTGGDNFLIHLKQGYKYKVEDVYDNIKLLIKNDFGMMQYYDISRFEEIKELRKQKILKLNKNI
jgi:hypothetical protein